MSRQATSIPFGYQQPTDTTSGSSERVAYFAWPSDSAFLILVAQDDGTYFNVAPWYEARSLKIGRTTGGERDTFSFVLMDRPITQGDGSTLRLTDVFPIGTVIERDVQIWAGMPRSGERHGVRGGILLARGAIRRPRAQAKSCHADGTFALRWEVQCTGTERELDSKTVAWTYQGNLANPINTAGWIARDIVLNHATGFVAALEDGTPTIVTAPGESTFLPIYEGKNRKPAEILDELAEIEGWSWSVVPFLASDGRTVKNAVYFGPPSLNPGPLNFTDAALEMMVDTEFYYEPDSTNLVNHIEMHYRTEYSEGQVIVSLEDDAVNGVGTNFLSHVRPGSQFQVIYPGLTDTNTVKEVLSDTSLILADKWQKGHDGEAGHPPYLGPRAADGGTENILIDGGANGSYRIFDIPAAQVATDRRSAKALARLRGYGDGVVKQFIESNKHYTFDEARAYLNAILAEQSNPIVNVRIETTSWAILQAWKAGHGDKAMSPWDIRAGQWFTFDVNGRFPIHETLQLKQVDIEDMGGFINPPASPTAARPIPRGVWESTKDDPPHGFPLLKYTLSFETRLYSLGKLLKKYEQQADRETVSSIDPVSTTLYAPSGSVVQDTYRVVESVVPALWQSDPPAANQTITALVETNAPGVELSNLVIGVTTALEAGKLTGYWVSTPYVLRVPLRHYPAAVVAGAQANGGTIDLAYRGVYFNGAQVVSATPWVATPSAVPETAGPWGVNAIQFKVTLARAETFQVSPSFTGVTYQDAQQIAYWGYSEWGGPDDEPMVGVTFSKNARWSQGTPSNGNITVDGDRLKVIGDGGTWTSPWVPTGTLPALLRVLVWSTGVQTTSTDLAVSLDATEATASPWLAQASLPVGNFVRVRVGLRATGVEPGYVSAISLRG